MIRKFRVGHHGQRSYGDRFRIDGIVVSIAIVVVKIAVDQTHVGEISIVDDFVVCRGRAWLC